MSKSSNSSDEDNIEPRPRPSAATFGAQASACEPTSRMTVTSLTESRWKKSLGAGVGRAGGAETEAADFLLGCKEDNLDPTAGDEIAS